MALSILHGKNMRCIPNNIPIPPILKTKAKRCHSFFTINDSEQKIKLLQNKANKNQIGALNMRRCTNMSNIPVASLFIRFGNNQSTK